MPELGFKTSWLIPSSRVTDFDHKRIRDSLALALIDRLKRAAVVSTARDAVVRDIRPATDLAFAQQTFLSAAMVANTWLALVNNLQCPTTKAIGLYGVAIDSAAPGTSQLRIAPGVNAGDRYVYHLEELYEEDNFIGYFSEPYLVDPQEFLHIQIFPRVAVAAGERVVLLGLVAERPGLNITQERAGSV